jgi:hypothetical protein
MLAWEIAQKLQQENSKKPFEVLLGEHLSCGLVHSTPSLFLLAHQVRWDPVAGQIVFGKPNAWFVALAAAAQPGALREFLRVANCPLDFLLWCRQFGGRNSRIHAWRWDRFQRVAHQPIN